MPANCTGVIAVTSTNRAGSLAYLSNYGSIVKISAPGGEQTGPTDKNGILTTMNTGSTVPLADTYLYEAGTSMATANVTGVVSLMFSVNPSLTPSQVLSILQSTARPFPSGSSCLGSFLNQCGSGIVDAAEAVTAAQALKTFTLSITNAGTGIGAVTSNPTGIDCGFACSYAFPYNTGVKLTAAAGSTSIFTGWSGAGCSGAGTCTVTMIKAQAITANFNLANLIYLPLIIR